MNNIEKLISSIYENFFIIVYSFMQKQEKFFLIIFLIIFVSLFINYNLNCRNNELEQISQGEQVLTPQKAVNIAIHNNPQLKKFLETINQKQVEKYAAYGLYSPSVIYTQEGIPVGNSTQFSEKRWTVSQDLEFPYFSYLKIKQIDEQVKALQLEYEWRKKELIAEIKQSYTRVVYFIELIKLRNDIKEIADKLYEIVKSKVELGQISNLDLLNAEISKMEAENDYNDAVRNLMIARYDLFYSMGLDLEYQQYTIEFLDSLRYFEFSIPQEEILMNLEKTYDYQSASKNERANSLMVSQAWSSLLPSLNLNYYKQNYTDGFKYTGFEIGIKVPLWLGLDKRTEIEQAKSKHRESQLGLYETRLRIKRQIEHAWHSFDISREIILNYKNNISDKSQKLLELTLESYQLGQTDLLNLLNVQKTYVNSKIRYLDALMDYYKQIIDLEKYLDNEVVFVN